MLGFLPNLNIPKMPTIQMPDAEKLKLSPTAWDKLNKAEVISGKLHRLLDSQLEWKHKEKITAASKLIDLAGIAGIVLLLGSILLISVKFR